MCLGDINGHQIDRKYNGTNTPLPKHVETNKRRRTLASAKIFEDDPVLHVIVEMRGFRFKNQINGTSSSPVIWVRDRIVSYRVYQNPTLFKKGVQCRAVRLNLDGLTANINEILRMKPFDTEMVPLHQYIQEVEEEKFVVFLYKLYHGKQIIFNGDDKSLRVFEPGFQFFISGKPFKYDGDNKIWTPTSFNQHPDVSLCRRKHKTASFKLY